VDSFEGLSNIPIFEFDLEIEKGKTPGDYFKSLGPGNNKIVFSPFHFFSNFMTDFLKIDDFLVIYDEFSDPDDSRTTVTLWRKLVIHESIR
jgi:hypothetical protein